MKYDENIHKTQHRCVKDPTPRLTYKIGPFDRENQRKELSASLCLYLGGYEPLSSKYLSSSTC